MTDTRAPAQDLVTRESALAAIDHLSLSNSPGRDSDACEMLVAASPSAPTGDGAEPHAEPPNAKHWHDLYRAVCLKRHDDAARYGAEIQALELQLSDQTDAASVAAWCGAARKVLSGSPAPAAISDEPYKVPTGFTLVSNNSIEWMKRFYPALCEKSGLLSLSTLSQERSATP